MKQKIINTFFEEEDKDTIWLYKELIKLVVLSAIASIITILC